MKSPAKAPMIMLTIVIGFRNREAQRVKRCLESLSLQTCKDFIVNFVDYGSDTLNAEETRKIVNEYTWAQYFYSDTRGYPWNRSKALNIGIRSATSKYVLVTDVDMIFSRNFIEILISNLSLNEVCYCFPRYLPQEFTDWNFLECYKDDLKQGTYRSYGGCQAASLENFHKINGYDEFYQFWGREDIDLHTRFNLLGLQEKWLNNYVDLYHQWHPRMDYETDGFMPSNLWGIMYHYFLTHKTILLRNDSGWGFICETQKRKIFEYINPDQSLFLKPKQIAILDFPPDNNKSIDKLVRAFDDLPSGYVLAINNMHYPKRNVFMDQIISSANLHNEETLSGIGYRPNLMRDFLFEFLALEKYRIADYYLGLPALNGVSFLLKK